MVRITERTARIGVGFALLLGSGAAGADPIAIITTPSGPTQTNLCGSDILIKVGCCSLNGSGGWNRLLFRAVYWQSLDHVEAEGGLSHLGDLADLQRKSRVGEGLVRVFAAKETLALSSTLTLP